MSEKITDSIYFIQGAEFDSNTILVLSDINFIVDTGTGMNIEILKNELSEYKIDAIVNTHCHFDHVGGNQEFALPVYIHEKDLPYLASGDENFCASKFFGKKLPKSNPLPLPKKFHGWEVLHTPGHTQGSICLYKDQVLISGDTLFADGVGRTDLPGGDWDQLQNSLNKLKNLDYTTLLPGHGF